MKKRVLLLSCVIASALSAGAQVSLTGANPTYSQDFNTLGTNATNNTTLPAGWILGERHTGANSTYAAGTGSSTTGDTYSFGSASATERAFGGLGSNNVRPGFGVSFLNNTANDITSIAVSFTGEQWRRGNNNAGQKDTLKFQYSLTATNAADTLASWVTVDALAFTSVITSTTVAALDGNATANKATISNTINLVVPSNGKLTIKWTDVNILGSDDGLAIDDLSLAFTTTSGGIPDTLVRFAPSSATIAENGGSQNLALSYTPTSPTSAFTAQVVLKSGNAADIAGYTTQTVNFAPNVATANVPVTITDNALVDGNKTLVFAIRNPSGAMLVGADSLFTLTVTDDDAPVVGPAVYTIAQVRGANTNGGPDSLNVTCELRGTVYGVNMRPGGLEFTINDGTAGIGVYAPAGASSFGYTVNEGDSIRVWGDVVNYRGLAQIAFLDTIMPAGSGNLKAPQVVPNLGEDTESKLVRINGCNVSGAPVTSAGGINYPCNCNGEIVTLRIHNNTTANGFVPSGLFDVIGIGGHFSPSTSAPFVGGYQIIPRKLQDIIAANSISENEASSKLSVFPNPTQGRFFVNFESASTDVANISLKDLTGRTISVKNVNMVSGSNQIEINENLSSGIYFVSIQMGAVKAVKRIIVR